MKNLLTAILFIALTGSSFSQHTTDAEKDLQKQSADTLDGWKTQGIFSLNISQVGLTNWAAGGNNSLSLNGLLSLEANLKKGSSTWDNSLDLAYGLLQQGEDPMIKSDDKIDLTSKYGQKAFNHWYYAALLNFKSQMTPGYNYPDDSTVVSNFLAPAYVLGAIGMDFKPNKAFSLFLSPLTMKMTVVNDQDLANSGAYGVDPAEFDASGKITTEGKITRAELGGYLRALFTKDIMKDINLKTKLELFSNYSLEPQNIDVNWEVLIAMKVNKYISATVSTQLIYDHDIQIAIDDNNDGIVDRSGPRTQFREVIGVGLSYKF